MPCITLPIEAGLKPTLEIGISSAASLLTPQASRPLIDWITCLVDTGCTHTSIHSSVAQTSRLPVMGKGWTNTGNGQVRCNQFLGDLFIRVPLPGGQVIEHAFRDRLFVELMTKIPQCDGLLGMDILTLGTLHLNGMTKNVTFCW
jgi:hypothetical protein